MVDYVNFAQAGVSLLLTMIIGYVTCKAKLLKTKAINPINLFLLKCCYFPMIMRNIAVRDLRNLSIMPFVIGVLTNLTIYILSTVIFLFPLRDKFYMYLSTVFSSVYVNYLILGFPIFNAIWDEKENVMVSIIALSNDIINIPIFLTLANIYTIRKENEEHLVSDDGEKAKFSFKIFVEIAKRVITNTLILGIIVGFIWAATGFKLCNYVDSLTKTLGGSVLALCLFTVGGFLSQHSLIACGYIQFGVCIAIRHFLMPLIVSLYSTAFKLQPRLARQCVIMSCLPTATAAYPVSASAGIGSEVASTMIFWTSILGVPFQLLWLYVFDKLGIFVE
ncbi:Auxin Efflux Carrier family protein [Tritrichomonas foetus]|uniref:Auxin Efflux Carrier family protein n=1 Tax=Tritrichomonas foetus TaxID=1144522 RepID=A0A1J4JGP8_9EUKA|nr:Auxin Efflux Carrier family protein [Tritrichomonas foetus]|eukprot:OHS97471.1 Auxin Efflux Carrier family protein [Tritrichomonas foetus]